MDTNQLQTFDAPFTTDVMVIPRERIFYSNYIEWSANQYEAFIDFKLLLPEHYVEVVPSESGNANRQADPRRVPIEVRVIIPRAQFDILTEKMAYFAEKRLSPTEDDSVSGGVPASSK